MITFTRAVEVAAGTRPTSTQHNALARAAQDRLRSNIGNMAWRLVYYLHSLVKQVTAPEPDNPLAFPAQTEWWDLYQLIDPGHSGLRWPAPPRPPNLANPLMAYHFGNPFMNAEETRLGDGASGVPLWLESGPPTTPEQYWQLHCLQAGGVDLDANVQAAPALDAAQSFIPISGYSQSGPNLGGYGESYGGYLAQPVILGDCGDGTDDQAPTPNLEIFFTSLKGEAPRTYPGTCPNTVGHVIGRPVAGYYAWFVPVYTGTDAQGNPTVRVDRLPRKDWIQGPYTGGGRLTKAIGGQMDRVLNYFAALFRGSDAQRAAAANLTAATRQYGFAANSFHAKHYLLAPQKGHQDGDTIVAEYPRFEWSGPSVAAGSQAPELTSSTAAYQHSDTRFVWTGYGVAATGLTAPATVELRRNGTAVATITLTAAAPSAVAFFDEAHAAPGEITLHAVTAISLATASDALYCELAIQQDYKPERMDAALVLRLASTLAADSEDLDTRGTECGFAREIYDDYRRYGAIVNRTRAALPVTGTSVNTSPVIDAARVLSRHVRVVRRQQLVGYCTEVVNGQTVSVIYARRYAYGLSNEEPADLFAGIAPDHDPINSGGIRPGYWYVVRPTGSVVYHGTTYSAGQTFQGLTGGTEFEAADGALVYEAEGIRPVAPPKGESNEWVMVDQLFRHSLELGDDTGTFKPSVYADHYLLHERCLWGSRTVNTQPDLLWHFCRGMKPPYVVEAPDGQRYARGVTPRSIPEEDWAEHFESCQVYPWLPELASVTEVTEGGEVRVKLVFKGRLSHSSRAPGSVDRTVSSAWDDYLDGERHRTLENALMSYLRFQTNGTPGARRLYGDYAPDMNMGWDGGNVWGGYFPRLCLVHLPPLVPEDQNDRPDYSTDATLVFEHYAYLELLLAAGCGGFIDELATAEVGCLWNGSSLMDFSYESLCYQANGEQWITLLPRSQRSDGAQGFGPVPNLKLWADTFNQLARCYNQLTRARLDLPLTLKCRQVSTRGQATFTPTWNPDGTCTENGQWHMVAPTAPNPPFSGLQTGDPPPWSLCTNLSAQRFVTFGGCGGSGEWIATGEHWTTEYVIELPETGSGAWRAVVPEHVWELLQSQRVGFLGLTTTSYETYTAVPVSAITDAELCAHEGQPDSGYCYTSGSGYRFELNAVPSTETCQLYLGGTISAPSLPAGALAAWRNAHLDTCTVGPRAQLNVEWRGDPQFYVEVPLV